MEDTAVERRAGMALVGLPASPGAARIGGSTVDDGVTGAIDGVMASQGDAVTTMRKPAGSVVLVEKTVALAMVGGAR